MYLNSLHYFDVDEYISTHESSKETMDPLNNKNSSGSSTTSKTTDTTKTDTKNKIQAQLQM